MIDHLSFYATQHATTRRFYEEALKPLGHKVVSEFAATWDTEFPGRKMTSFGPDARGIFWLIETKVAATPRHLAFSATSRAQVDAFFRAALNAGGKDNGPPALREPYGPHYYGAFVLDPDGNNVEAVCRAPHE